MKIFLMIIVNVILPVFILIGIGAFIHRKYKLDLNTLSKINNYLLMPAVSFVNIYQSEIRGEALLTIIGFLLLQNGCLILLSSIVAKISRFDRSLSATFKNSVVLNNSGNFGLPVSQLVFQHNPLGASIQVIVTIFQNFITYTYGLMNSASVHTKRSTAIKSFLKNPIFFALLLGLAFQMTAIKLPSFLWTPIDNISSAFIAVALITLGAQSAYLRINQFSLPLLLSLIGRLIISPMIALALILSLVQRHKRCSSQVHFHLQETAPCLLWNMETIRPTQLKPSCYQRFSAVLRLRLSFIYQRSYFKYF